MTHSLESFTKRRRFTALVDSVRHCNLCPRLCQRTPVLSEANGNVESQVLFVAEAPGRLGADRTGIPLCGDRSGDNFEKLLGNVGWRRGQVFITNAVLCNPRSKFGTNAPPASQEIANCSPYLEMVLALVNPAVVVALGTTALRALDLISPHGIDLKANVAQSVPWHGRELVPLYHPGPRATVHRSLAKQRADFLRLAKIVDPEKGPSAPPGRKLRVAPSLFPEGPSALQEVAYALLEICGRMTYFKLTKLLYLVDLTALRQLGTTVASNVYLRQVDGPWAPKLDEALQAMEGHEVRRFFAHRVPVVDIGPSPRFDVRLPNTILELVADVAHHYGGMTNAEIKAAAYTSEPMRFILREERKGKDMRNATVIYKDKTASDLHDTRDPR